MPTCPQGHAVSDSDQDGSCIQCAQQPALVTEPATNSSAKEAINGWRVWSSLLLAGAVIAEVPQVLQFIDFFGAPDGPTGAGNAAIVFAVLSLVATTAALILSLLGRRIAALSLATAALLLCIAQFFAWFVDLLLSGAPFLDAVILNIQQTFLGTDTDENGVSRFWPSWFFGGTVTWLLLGTAIVVLLLAVLLPRMRESSSPAGATA